MLEADSPSPVELSPETAAPEPVLDNGLMVAVHRLWGAFGREPRQGGVSPGDAAALRRMDPERPPRSLWRVLAAEEIDAQRDREWAMLACIGATLAGAGLHRPGLRLGRVLAGPPPYSDLRLARLLDAAPDRLWTELRSCAQFLAQKQQPVDLDDFARLILLSNDRNRASPGDTVSPAERHRRWVARDYYTHLPRD